jgi:large subunit ribosomal protein L32
VALPKRRHSKTRGRKRRTHWKVSSGNLAVCPQCKEPKHAHRICPTCGYYKGKQIIEIKAKKKKKRNN